MTESGIGASPALQQLQIGVDVRDVFNTGIALYNPTASKARVNVVLLGADGRVVDQVANLELAPHGHLARFVTDFFPQATAIQGSVVVHSVPTVAALTIRQNAVPLSFTTLPVVEREEYLPSSEELILEALAAGEIDEETTLVYRVFAVFGDPRLPARFHGDDTREFDSQIVGEVLDRFDTLSEATREILEPFLVPPFYAGSWVDVARTVDEVTPAQGVPPCTRRTECPVSPDWNFVDTANGKARIWYQKSLPGEAAKAAKLAQEVDRVIWPKLTALLNREPVSDVGMTNNGGDGRLDIALASLGSNLGLVLPYFGCEAVPTYALLESSQSSADLAAVAAHELMHSWQYSYDVQQDPCGSEYDWLFEATAAWVIDHVYPDSELEHQFVPAYLSTIDQASIESNVPERRWYGAYLFFFFLARQYSPEWIRHIWEATAEAGSLEALEKGLQKAAGKSLEELWPEFARLNWNRPPFDSYAQWDVLADQAKLAMQESLTMAGQYNRRIELDEVALPHLSASYYYFYLHGPDIRSFAFYNGLTYNLSEGPLGGEDGPVTLIAEPLQDDQKKGAHVQALVKIVGKDWETVDLTEVPLGLFCRLDPDETLEEVVFIFSNSQFKEGEPNFDELKPQGLPPTLFLSNMACLGWEGTGEMKRDDGGTVETMRANVRWERSSVGQFLYGQPGWKPLHSGELSRDHLQEEEVQIANPGYLFRLATAAIHWEINGSDGSCTVSGEADFSLTGNDPPIVNWMQTYNYVTGGDYFRAFALAGFDRWPDFMEVTEQWVCPPDEGGSYTETRELRFGAATGGVIENDGVTINWVDPQGDATISVRMRAKP